MKKIFSEPEVTVLRIEDNNVICTSSVICAGGGASETSVDYISF